MLKSCQNDSTMKTTKAQTLGTIWLKMLQHLDRKHRCMYWVNTLVWKISCIKPMSKVRCFHLRTLYITSFQYKLHWLMQVVKQIPSRSTELLLKAKSSISTITSKTLNSQSQGSRWPEVPGLWPPDFGSVLQEPSPRGPVDPRVSVAQCAATLTGHL